MTYTVEINRSEGTAELVKTVEYGDWDGSSIEVVGRFRSEPDAVDFAKICNVPLAYLFPVPKG